MNKSVFLLILVLFACNGGPTQKDVDCLFERIDSISKDNEMYVKKISELRDSISLLAFPADQRLDEIKSIVCAEDFLLAKSKIRELKQIFPKSKEVLQCVELEKDIEQKEAKLKAEQERIKALGFKALSPKTNFQIDYNKVALTSISIGTQFTYDVYDGGSYYNTADRGMKYISISMSVTSSVKDPKLPEVAIYSIHGDKMEEELVYVSTKFARWSDYGCYLGNYHDDKNDFSKVSTVKFKVGIEISTELLSKPFAIVCKKENVLERKDERYHNPPVSYEGFVSYKSTLTTKDFEKDYILVKLYNM